MFQPDPSRAEALDEQVRDMRLITNSSHKPKEATPQLIPEWQGAEPQSIGASAYGDPVRRSYSAAELACRARDQIDLQPASCRVRLVVPRTATLNQIRAFLIERWPGLTQIAGMMRQLGEPAFNAAGIRATATATGDAADRRHPGVGSGGRYARRSTAETCRFHIDLGALGKALGWIPGACQNVRDHCVACGFGVLVND